MQNLSNQLAHILCQAQAEQNIDIRNAAYVLFRIVANLRNLSYLREELEQELNRNSFMRNLSLPAYAICKSLNLNLNI